VTSAYRIGIDFFLTNIGKSFMKRRKSKGPRMEPCGTPCMALAPVLVMALCV